MTEKQEIAIPTDALDELDRIRARMRLFELALLGAHASGMSLDDPTYLDGMSQQATDISLGLDQLAKALRDGESNG